MVFDWIWGWGEEWAQSCCSGAWGQGQWKMQSRSEALGVWEPKGYPRVRGGDVHSMEGGITEPQTAVGAKDTIRVMWVWLLPWSMWGEARGRDHGTDMYRHVTEDPVAREPQRGPQPRLESRAFLKWGLVPGTRSSTACQGLKASCRSVGVLHSQPPWWLALGARGGHTAEGSVSGKGQGKWVVFLLVKRRPRKSWREWCPGGGERRQEESKEGVFAQGRLPPLPAPPAVCPSLGCLWGWA